MRKARSIQLNIVLEVLLVVVLAAILALEVSCAKNGLSVDEMASDQPVATENPAGVADSGEIPVETATPSPSPEPTATPEPTEEPYAEEDLMTEPAEEADVSKAVYSVDVLDREEAEEILNAAPLTQRQRNTRLLAQAIWGEARGINSKVEQSAVAWCILNRLDHGGYGNSILEVLSEREQFTGWNESNPVLPHHLELAEDVYDAWLNEKDSGEDSELRTIPRDFLYYWGDNVHNWFVTDSAYIGQKGYAWTWAYSDPFEEGRDEYLARYYPSKHELTMMAQVVWHKARGLKSTQEQAAIVWVILNRVQSEVYEDTVQEVLEHARQFSKFNQSLSTDKKYYQLVVDVVDRWHQEMNGATGVGRVIPSNYLYFRGNKTRNYFYTDRYKSNTWNWSNTNPYND